MQPTTALICRKHPARSDEDTVTSTSIRYLWHQNLVDGAEPWWPQPYFGSRPLAPSIHASFAIAVRKVTKIEHRPSSSSPLRPVALVAVPNQSLHLPIALTIGSAELLPFLLGGWGWVARRSALRMQCQCSSFSLAVVQVVAKIGPPALLLNCLSQIVHMFACEHLGLFGRLTGCHCTLPCAIVPAAGFTDHIPVETALVVTARSHI